MFAEIVTITIFYRMLSYYFRLHLNLDKADSLPLDPLECTWLVELIFVSDNCYFGFRPLAIFQKITTDKVFSSKRNNFIFYPTFKGKSQVFQKESIWSLARKQYVVCCTGSQAGLLSLEQMKVMSY